MPPWSPKPTGSCQESDPQLPHSSRRGWNAANKHKQGEIWPIMHLQYAWNQGEMLNEEEYFTFKQRVTTWRFWHGPLLLRELHQTGSVQPLNPPDTRNGKGKGTGIVNRVPGKAHSTENWHWSEPGSKCHNVLVAKMSSTEIPEAPGMNSQGGDSAGWGAREV